MSEKSEVQQDQRQKHQPPASEQSPSPVEELRDEELLALTGKEQLKVYSQWYQIPAFLSLTFQCLLNHLTKTLLYFVWHNSVNVCVPSSLLAFQLTKYNWNKNRWV